MVVTKVTFLTTVREKGVSCFNFVVVVCFFFLSFFSQ